MEIFICVYPLMIFYKDCLYLIVILDKVGFWQLLYMLALLSRLLVCSRVWMVSCIISVTVRQVRLFSGSSWYVCFIRFWISFYCMQPVKSSNTTYDSHNSCLTQQIITEKYYWQENHIRAAHLNQSIYVILSSDAHFYHHW